MDPREWGEKPASDLEILERALQRLRSTLPTTWSMNLIELGANAGPFDPDAVAEVAAPDGRVARFPIEIKRRLEAKAVPELQERLMAPDAVPGLIVAPYLNVSVREKLQAYRINYVDVTGNIRIALASPALYVVDRGSQRDPWRGPGRPRNTLKGFPAAKVVQILIDFRGPWRVSDLIKVSDSAAGTTYRVLDFLDREGLAVKDESGTILVTNWEDVLRRWSADYELDRQNTLSAWIDPRGIPELRENLQRGGYEDYAVSGSLAASEWAPYAPPRNALIYVKSANEAARAWDLRPTDRYANVQLAEPLSPHVFHRTQRTGDGIRLVTPSQVFADLFKGPGRAPAEAEELVNWMKRNESSWRK